MSRRFDFSDGSFRTLLLVILAAVLSGGCIGPRYWDGYVGKVVDADTGEPLAGAFVIARYSGSIPTPGHSNTVCYHAAGTTSNEGGDYRIPSSVDVLDIKVDKRSRLDFFKPGYRHVFYKDGIAKLEKDKGSREGRLEELTRIVRSSNCIQQDVRSRQCFHIMSQSITKQRQFQ